MRIKSRKKDGFYKFFGYRSFQNRTIGKTIENKKTKEKERDSEGNYIMDTKTVDIKNLDNCILIVDEAHNITDNLQGEAIRHIMSVSQNIRLVLLSATPMSHKPCEIIEMLNFLRPKDDPIYLSDIFKTNKRLLTCETKNTKRILSNKR